MDGIDILTVIIGIAAYLFFTVRKYKKKEEAAGQRRKQRPPIDIFEEPKETEPVFETVRRPMSHSSAPPHQQNMPKSDEYFTYEETSAPIGNNVVEQPHPTTASTVQAADIEEENESTSLPLREEIDKAVLYSEILKRPYN